VFSKMVKEPLQWFFVYRNKFESVEKLRLNIIRRLKISLMENDFFVFFKGGQLNFPKIFQCFYCC
jgi:hypothetical protein